MKLSQKKTCNKCKAFYVHTGHPNPECSLGYKIITEGYIPAEPCPKPITNREYIVAIDYYKKTSGYTKPSDFTKTIEITERDAFLLNWAANYLIDHTKDLMFNPKALHEINALKKTQEKLKTILE